MDSTPVMPQLSSSSSSDDTKFSLPQKLKKFYLGEPLALGVTQILTGIIGIAFGVALDITDRYYTEFLVVKTPYWTGILYLISGSLSVAAARNPKMSLVKGMLGMNVVSAVAAGIEIIFLCISLSFSYRRWYISYICEHHELEENKEQCVASHVGIYNTIQGILAIFLAFTVLELCIAISTAAFGCKTACRDAYTETVVVVYQNMTPINATSQTAVSKDAEALWTQFPSTQHF